jgi:hypothetical protein
MFVGEHCDNGKDYDHIAVHAEHDDDKDRAHDDNSDEDIVEDCGLAETMVDIPVLGAASMLLRTTENRRNQITVQGDSRRSDEVVSGGNSSAADGMARMYRDRVNQEYIRLTSRTPIFKGI